MGNFQQVMASIAGTCETRTRRDTDYLDEKTGLMFCGLCHTPKQVRINWMGQPQTVYCVCRCMEEQHRQEEQQRALEERIYRNRGKATIPSLYAQATCSHISDEKQRKYAGNYVRKFHLIGNKGFLFYGDVGTGKSYAAACIANDLLQQGKSVKWLSAVALSDAVKPSHLGEYEAFLQAITEPDLLIIDDLGAERGTDYALEKIHSLIDKRISALKPLIVTTNLSLQDMRRVADLRKKRTYDRIFQCCFPMGFFGNSFREKQARDNFESVKELLASD